MMRDRKTGSAARAGLALIGAVLVLPACRGEEPQFTARHDHGSEAECENPTPPAIAEAEEDEAPGPRPIRTAEDGSRIFGRELQDGIETVTLSSISTDAPSFTDRVVRTEGTIERVCQRMGCWMELRAENAEPVRVPMAGHSYFLPRDVAGRPATVEGRVHVQELTEARRRHLEAEGAMATTGTLSIEATTVVVR
jgi:hypothetical protein